MWWLLAQLFSSTRVVPEVPQVPDCFAKVPLEIREVIVKKTDTKTRLTLAKLSHDFHQIIERSQMTYESLTMTVSNSRIAIQFNDGLEVRQRHFEPCQNGYVMRNPMNKWEKQMDGDYRKAAVAFFLGIFKNSKVTIERLEIKVSIEKLLEGPMLMCQLLWTGRHLSRFTFEKFAEDRAVLLDEMHRILAKKGFQLSVKTLYVDLDMDQDQILQILPYLKPRILEAIIIHHSRPNRPSGRQMIGMDRIVETDQWKEAKNFSGFMKVCSLPFDKWAHFERVAISVDTVNVRMVDIMEKLLETPHFRACLISFPRTANFDNVEELLDRLRSPERRTGRPVLLRINDKALMMSMGMLEFLQLMRVA